MNVMAASRLLALASSRPPQLLVGGRRFIDLRRVIASAVAVLRRGGGFGPPELLLPGVDAVVKRIRQRTAATTIQVGDDVLHRVKKCCIHDHIYFAHSICSHFLPQCRVRGLVARFRADVLRAEKARLFAWLHFWIMP